MSKKKYSLKTRGMDERGPINKILEKKYGIIKAQ